MRAILKGSTDQSVDLYIVDNTTGLPATGLAFNSSGIDLWYRRAGAAVTSITEATQTASGAHSDGGFVHLANGVYRLDPPDAAFASGVDFVTFGGTLTGYTVYPVTVQLTAFDLQTAIPSANVRSLPNVWYLSASGNDSNDGKTAATPKLTPSGVESAATQGDLCVILPGTIGSTHTFAMDGMTWRGVDKQTCIFSQSGSNSRTITITGDSVTIENLTVTNTGAEGGGSNGPVAIYAGGTHNATIRRCTTNGQKDSIDVRDSHHAHIFDCDVNGTWDAINVGAARNFAIIGNQISCDGSWSDLSAVVSGIAGGQFLGGAPEDNRQVGVIYNNEIRVVTSLARTNEVVGINFGGLADIRNNKIVVRATSASATGAVSGISDVAASQAAFPFAQGNMIFTSTAGSGTVRDVNMGHASGVAQLAGTTFSASKLHGAVYEPLQGGVAGRRLGVESDGDLTKVNTLDGHTPQTGDGYPIVSSGTHGNEALKTLVDAKASQASVDNVPTNAELATALDPLPTAAENASAILAAALSTGTVQQSLEYMRAAFASSGVFSEPALENAPSGGEGGNPVAADVVDDSRTWFATEYRARNIISVAAPFEGTLALKPDLNPGTTIKETDSVTIVGPEVDEEPLEPVATTFTVNRAKDRAHCNVPELTVPGSYDFTWTVETVDGQVLTTTGTLKVH